MWKPYLAAVAVVAYAGLIPAYGQCKDVTVDMVNTQGQSVGTAILSDTPDGVLIHANLHDLPQGWHAFHLHSVGQCNTPDFSAAGGHFNPTKKAHGYRDMTGPHLGDLPNVFVGADGKLEADAIAEGVSLTGENALLDNDNAALVIHATGDDYTSQPAGNAGGRIVCGVIKP